MHYEYYINLDERGEFHADVRDNGGMTVFEIGHYCNTIVDMVELGFMKHNRDIDGLREYLVSVDIMQPGDKLVKAN